MGYRSLKRVLGETSLERKCRLLFGTCLFLLISGAFIWVDKIAEEQITRTDRQKRYTARQTARSFADTGLLKLHFIQWDLIRDKRSSPVVADGSEGLIPSMVKDMDQHNYDHAVLAFSEDIELAASNKQKLLTPISDDEMGHVQKLLELKRQREIEAAQRSASEIKPPEQDNVDDGEGPDGEAKEVSEQPTGDSNDTSPRDADAANREEPGGFANLVAPIMGYAKEEVTPTNTISTDAFLHDDDGKQFYAYYQLLQWKDSCVHCHPNSASGGALSAAEAGLLQQEPLRVVRVIFPHQWTDKEGVDRIRAILTSASILTFFVAMIALYVIVRYVIVKPLQHLRDVSDEISRGVTGLRADIHTNDEFEDLADSFNRMLRHLTDTQQNLRGVNEDLDAKVDELAQLNMQLHEMNRLKSDFLANMSHELRTPLNSIIGFSEVLSGIDSLTDKQKRYANNIQKSGRVLLEMINDILDLAKVEAGKMELKPSEFKIEAIISAQCDMVRSLSEEKNIDLIVDVASELPTMYQDQGKIQQILTNLLSNAIKFTPEGGRIDVHASIADDGRVLMTVQDTGVGIPEEDREIIFEKFRQSNTVLGDNGLTREYSGTGLGLSIVKELCKLLNGELGFESDVGKGSRFMVWLPVDVTSTSLREGKDEPKLPAQPPIVSTPAAEGASPGNSRW